MGFHFRVAKPLFQSEAKCEAIEMEMMLYSHANETHFLKKGFALSLVLKVRVSGTQNWLIDGLCVRPTLDIEHPL